MLSSVIRFVARSCSPARGIRRRRATVARRFGFAAVTIAAIGGTVACGEVSDEQVRLLIEDNRQMRLMIERQREELDELRGLVEGLTGTGQPNIASPKVRMAEPALAITTSANDSRRVIVSGQAGLAFFAGQSENSFRNAEFRVDDAAVNLEANLANRTYFFSELYLTRRETSEETVRMGEVYVDFENVSGLWGADGLVSLRFGRIDIPFGEEYMRRDPIANPLVTHSLSDIWGIDEGVEIYGAVGPASYVFAVQNGSHKELHDFNADKALTGRIGFSPARGWQLSASAMRTGDLDAEREPLSEAWIGNSFFRPIGSPATTLYRANLAGIDARYDWRAGHLAAAAGLASYSDNDPIADSRRRLDFFHVEAVQSLSRTFYGAVRYSELRADRGYPIAGLGKMGKYFFGGLHTKELWRLGLGLGYRPSPRLLLKAEYTFEEGELIDGTPRRNTNQFSTEAAVQF